MSRISEPELIVVAKQDAALRVGPSGLRSLAGADTSSLSETCSKYGASMRTLFGHSEERLLREASSPDETVAEVAKLATYYRVDAPAERLHDIARELREQPLVEAAYVKPPAEPPHRMDMPPLAEEPPSTTPDFFSLQEYLGPAPGGIDVRQAWALRGGR